MKTISINFVVPTCWRNLSDKELKYVYQLLADNFSIDEIKLLCLLRWSGTTVIGRQEDGSYLLKKDKTLFEATPLNFAEILPQLEWLERPSSYPKCLSHLRGKRAFNDDFEEVPFETYIMADNLYQGYLQTQDDELLDQIASLLYDINVSLEPWERISIFYWMASLKEFFSRKFPDFFQPMAASADGNLLGSPTATVEAAMNAQIRALTKGDITKESEILSLDTWRALTELNAQAKEYRELNSKLNSK